MRELIDDRLVNVGSAVPDDNEQLLRQHAIRYIEARRRFKISTTASGLGVALLVPIWAATEYHHAGGWPTHGFSQRSGTFKVWNVWIIYPIIAWASLTAAHGLAEVFRADGPD